MIVQRSILGAGLVGEGEAGEATDEGAAAEPTAIAQTVTLRFAPKPRDDGH